jgi:hypothetical protein
VLLQLLRGGFGTGAAILVAAGLAVSVDHERDAVLTYVVLFGLAGLSILGTVATTVAIERRNSSGNSTTRLVDWLDARVKEVRALQRELEGLGPPSPQQYVAVQGVENSLAHLNNQVRSRLVTDAPEWVAYYREMPDWYQEHFLLGDGERHQLHRLLDYTAGQLNRIREDQR